MQEQIFIDTGFIIALVNEPDDYHQQALELGDTLETSYFVTTDAVLLEIGNGLSRKYKQEAIQIIEQFIYADNVEIVATSELFNNGFEEYKKYRDKQWGLVDCLSFFVMWNKGINKVLTFDKHFKQAGFDVITNIL
ncbi:MAG: PIN domain-containing protein [Xenococcaceae cyanobacterium MO_167.B52]|nr:PIN domain-containing protein [Xenococcaceae cyanobacterium MO_167.B52]